jgi:5-methylcytosine-specific restriction endonuclease McrA
VSDEQEKFDFDSARGHVAELRAQIAGQRPGVYNTGKLSCRKCGGHLAMAYKDGNGYRGVCVEHPDVFIKWIPKAEVGVKPRTVSTLRRPIRPRRQQEILDRDHGRCIFCGRTEDLSIDLLVRPQHLLSVADGHQLGFTSDELNDEANLAAMCEACNLGLQGRSVTLRTVQVRIWLGLLRAEITRREQGRQRA